VTFRVIELVSWDDVHDIECETAGFESAAGGPTTNTVKLSCGRWTGPLYMTVAHQPDTSGWTVTALGDEAPSPAAPTGASES